jgi:hypothetical protein
LFAMASTISMPYGWLQGSAPLHIPGFWAPIRSLFHNCVYSLRKALTVSLQHGCTLVTDTTAINGPWDMKCEDPCSST